MYMSELWKFLEEVLRVDSIIEEVYGELSVDLFYSQKYLENKIQKVVDVLRMWW